MTQQLPKECGFSVQLQNKAGEENTHTVQLLCQKYSSCEFEYDKKKRINYYLATDKYVYEPHQIFSKYGINKKDVLCWAKGIHQNILNVLK